MRPTPRESGVLKVLADLGVGHSYIPPGVDHDEATGGRVTVRPLNLDTLRRLVERGFVAKIADAYSITRRGMKAIGRERLGAT